MLSVCVSVCVCVRERGGGERESMYVCVRACVRVRMCMSVRAAITNVGQPPFCFPVLLNGSASVSQPHSVFRYH